MTFTYVGSSPTCEWPTGTVYTGPRECGKPAKFGVENTFDGLPFFLCGIHARVVRRRDPAGLRPLAKQSEADIKQEATED